MELTLTASSTHVTCNGGASHDFDLHDTDDYLVKDVFLLRGLSPDQRKSIAAPDAPLHVVAVASDPLGALSIDEEWQRLTDVFAEPKHRATLERSRPATLERLGDMLAGQQQRVIHFMRHGGKHEGRTPLK